MTLIADFLLASGAFAIAIYCLVLSKRLKQLSTLESGMGNAVALLSAQVDDMTKILTKAQSLARESSSNLDERVNRAESATAKLEMLLASLHDLPAASTPPDYNTPASDEKRPKFVRRRPDTREVA